MIFKTMNTDKEEENRDNLLRDNLNIEKLTIQAEEEHPAKGTERE